MNIFEAAGIDIDLSSAIKNAYNNGEYSHVKAVEVKDVPDVNGNDIIDISSQETTYCVSANHFKAFIKANSLDQFADLNSSDESVILNKAELESIGTALMPKLAMGVLNGGSATSYGDTKKNSGFNAGLFDLYKETFSELAELAKNKPKGIVPAYINPDGSPGFSFIELRMRNILINALKFKQQSDENANIPFFQMTSKQTSAPLAEAYKAYAESAALKDLISETATDITNAESREQPLISAFTQGNKKDFFTKDDGSALALPGGHGQNFYVLKDVFQGLLKQGKKFAYLGNVDNLGFTINPVALAILALSGKNAAFDFSFKTAVDIKGGILIRDTSDHLNCADIGVGIPKNEVEKLEESGKKILFNCATGLFNLEYLCANIDRIIKELPMRFSDQNKDAGKYSQAEQVTWEVIGILEEPLILGVNKFERFLAAKLLTETMLTSGYKMDKIAEAGGKDIAALAQKLNNGLQRALQEEYGMILEKSKWRPLSVEELKKRF